jgi:hypothetical protein
LKPDLRVSLRRQKLQHCWCFPILTAGEFDQPG